MVPHPAADTVMNPSRTHRRSTLLHSVHPNAYSSSASSSPPQPTEPETRALKTIPASLKITRVRFICVTFRLRHSFPSLPLLLPPAVSPLHYLAVSSPTPHPALPFAIRCPSLFLTYPGTILSAYDILVCPRFSPTLTLSSPAYSSLRTAC